MSFFGFSRLFAGSASKRRSNGRSGSAGSPKKRGGKSRRARPRRLQFDPLEARQLLTVSPADLSDMLVSQQLDLYNAAFPEPNLRADYPAQSQFTEAARALAGDNDGDFVVTWTRNDPVIDPNTGLPVTNPQTGLPQSDLNIYARYLTDEVQRIFLPAGVLDNNNPTPFTNGKFSLLWGGNEVQKISITATNPPTYGFAQNIQGTITFGFDVNENGVIDNNEKTTVVFNENDFGASAPSARPQAIIQTQLRGLGGPLADVVVEATDPHTYIVYFGAASQGKDQPLITVESQSYTSGFFPATLVSTIRQPTLISNITVASSANTASLDAWAAAQATAAQIERAFAQQTSQQYFVAPVDVQPPDLYNRLPPSPAPYSEPQTRRAPISVSVVPVDLTAQGYALGTVFDITFTGAYAKQDVPLMAITDVRADNGVDLTPLLPAVPVKTMKQSSAEFRVNPPDPVNPVTGEPEPLDQRNPAIAMDADGDFVITWESDIPNSANPGSVSDIFARRFSPMGMVDDPSSVRGFVTQGVRSWVNDIQVITFDPNLAGPLAGTFRVQIPNWVTGDTVTSEPITFDSRALGKVATDLQTTLIMAGYSGARVRQISGVDPYQFEVTFGGRQAGLDVPQIVITGENWTTPAGVSVAVQVDDASDSTFRVNTTTTNRQVTPAIGMDAEGNFVIAWANVAQDLSYFNRIAYQRFNRDGDPVGSETLAPTQTPDITAVYLNPAVALSPDGHYALAWEYTTDPGFFQGGVYVTTISALIYDPAGTPGPFLALGAGAAGNPSLAFDPANNLAVAWNVIVPDNLGGSATSDSQAQVFRVNGTVLRAPFRINSATGAGLGTANWSLSQLGPQMGFDADGDLIATYDGYGVDMSNRVSIAGSYFAAYINDTTNADLKAFFNPDTDSLLGIAGYSPMSSDVDGAIEYVLYRAYDNGATPDQIGRLRAILDEVAGLLRGDANGVMFSRWDTDPNVQGTNTVLTADNQANNKRDGQNTRLLLAIPVNASAGNLTPTLVRGDIGANNTETVTITVAYQQIGNINVVNPVATLDNIRTAMNGARLVGRSWPATGNWYYPNDATRVQVRRVFGAELDARATTPWAFPWTSGSGYYVYELNFQGDAHDAPFWFNWPGNSARLDTPTSGVYVWADSAVESLGRAGTPQFNASLAVTRSGNFTIAWTEQALYTDGAVSNTSIMYRRFQDDAGDTAGPLVTDVLRADGTVLYDNDTIVVPQGGTSNVTQIIITFDEDMMTSGIGSVTSPGNYRLLLNGMELVGGVRSVQYGMNKAADLGLGGLPPNKFQAVLTLDGNGNLDGVPPLPLGQYEIQLIPGSASGPGLRDKVGNPLGSSGYNPAGSTFSRTFVVDEIVPPLPPLPGTDTPVISATGANGRTHPESPNAVASDSDGDYVVVWTAPDGLGRDSIFFRLFNADGSAASAVLPVAPLGLAPTSFDDAQRNGSVAMDADGDFIVTWTFFDGQDEDVYARRFNSMGEALDAPFRVNTFTANAQKWSDVAMDADGDFVIVWSSLGQEDPTTGTGYGVYARRYDSFGVPLAQEFLVNVTTAGDQVFPSVAMDALGGFVVTWTSNGNGIGDDIMYRSFAADGSPVPTTATGQGSLYGEGIANQTLQGDQRYSDVSMTADGTGFVITWTSAGQDGSGDGVYGRVFPRALQALPRRQYSEVLDAPPPTGQRIPPEGALLWDFNRGPNNAGLTTFYINVTDTFQINDLNVLLSIRHPNVSDLLVTLVDPQGNSYRLVDRRPQNPAGTYLAGANFSDTIFDDQALTSIGVYPQASPPFTGVFRPEQALTGVNGTLATGVWELRISDQNAGPWINPQAPPAQREPIPAYLDKWILDFEPILVPGDEFRVASTSQGNQSYPSIAMDRSGNFVVAWSGRGTQPGQEDTNGTGGVFYQRFRYTPGGIPTRVGGETRANRQTDGDQQFASVASDADGNFVTVWTGRSSTSDATDVFMFRSRAVGVAADTSAPWVSDVLVGGQRKLSGDTIEGTINQMTVVFDELMAFRDGAAGAQSVLNPNNWRLTQDGTDVSGRIKSIDFPVQRNPLTRKYEATITFDPPLSAGSYSLTARDSMYDGISQAVNGPNALDGDFDGRAGTDVSRTGADGYRFDFKVVPSSSNPIWAETLVNQNIPLEQRFSSHFGTGLGEEQSNHTLAVDHDGDFVVVWTSYGQDDPTDPMGAGVYARVYDRNNVPLTNEFQVNTYVKGHQRNASVAIDADGDFVVVWESEGQDPNGTWGIYARRFDSLGRPKDAKEFRVNSWIANDQVNPAVAMDDFGNFVVVWATGGQTYSYFNDIRGQLFDNLGNRIDQEFLVTRANLPGVNTPGSAENNPAVAMDPLGVSFVVAWDQVTQQRNGAAMDTVIYARQFPVRDAAGNLLFPSANTNAEFRVDVGDDAITDPEHNVENASGGTTTRRQARNPQITMGTPVDTDGDGNPDRAGFIVAWESFHDNDDDGATGADSYGIYFRRFNADGTEEMDSDHQANMVITRPATGGVAGLVFASNALEGHQVNPSVAMDADGDYAVVWNGPGAQVHPIDPTNFAVVDVDPDGVWIRNFHARDDNLGSPEFVSVQTRVNETRQGIQEFPTIGMTREGQRVVAWSGRGTGDANGIFFRRYPVSVDTAGPLVSDVVSNGVSLGVSTFQPNPSNLTSAPPAPVIIRNDNLYAGRGVSSLVVVFNEDMFNALPPGSNDPLDPEYARDSVTNRANYRLMKDGADVSGLIRNVSYAFNPATNKYEATLTLDANPATTALDPLPDGTYELRVMGNLRDKMGNRMGVTGLFQNGYEYLATRFDAGVSGTGDPSNPGTPVNSVSLAGRQDSPAVARAPDGSYVVAWVTYGQTVTRIVNGVTQTFTDGTNQGNVVAQRFDASGRRVGNEIVVNTRLVGHQFAPDIAMDGNGNFVVVWTGEGQGGGSGVVDRTGIFYRRFDMNGNPLDAFEQRANTYTQNLQNQPAVDMDPQGNFVIVWAGEGRAGKPNGKGTYDSRGVWARRYSSTGLPVDTYQVLVNTTRTRTQESPDVALDGDGDYMVVWRSERQGAGAWSVYAQRFEKNGTRVGKETRLNTKTYGAKLYPQVDMDDVGNAVVVWSGMRVEGYGDRVYMRRFRADSTAIDAKEVYADEPASAQYLKQQASVAMTNDGKYIAVAWTSFAQDEATSDPPVRSDGVYAHVFYNPDPADPASAWGEYLVNGLALGDFRLNANVVGNQNDPYVAVGPTGGMTTVWVSPNPNDPTTGLDIWARTVAVGSPSVTTLTQGGSTSGSSSQSALQSAVIGGAALAASTQGSTAKLADSALSDASTAQADPAALLFGPVAPLGYVQPTATSAAASTPTSGGTSASSLHDSALASLLGAEESGKALTNLDAAIAVPLGPVVAPTMA